MVRDGIGFQPIPGVGVAVLPADIEIDFADPFAEVNGKLPSDSFPRLIAGPLQEFGEYLCKPVGGRHYPRH